MIFSKKNSGRGAASSYKVINISQNTTLAGNAKLADNFFRRFIGLMGKASLKSGGALILKPCVSIHTFFMRFPIDVAFTDKKNQIIKIYPSLKSWRLTGVFLNSTFCLELPAGTLAATRSQVGDTIQFVSNL